MCMCTCMCMGTKTISIMDDVYKLLLLRKRAYESFSDLIRRRFREKRDVMEFAGVWKNIGDEEISDMKEKIRRLRKKSTEEIMRKR